MHTIIQRNTTILIWMIVLPSECITKTIHNMKNQWIKANRSKTCLRWGHWKAQTCSRWAGDSSEWLWKLETVSWGSQVPRWPSSADFGRCIAQEIQEAQGNSMPGSNGTLVFMTERVTSWAIGSAFASRQLEDTLSSKWSVTTWGK